MPKLTLDPADRLLILAPHPDDEVLGCGGVIQQAVARDLPLRIVFLTYGDSYEWSFFRYEKRPVLTPRGALGMGAARRAEALAAGATLGVPPAHLIFLGYPDSGMLKIWYGAWDGARPVRGRLTRVTAVPYEDAYRPGALYRGEEVLKDLTTLLRTFRPTKVFVSHPADHHPDHKSLYLFARVALFDILAAQRGPAQGDSSRSGTPRVPQVYPYLVHYPRWPAPHGCHPEAPLAPPKSLQDAVSWYSADLDPTEVSRKRDALRKHRSQCTAIPRFLGSFVRQNELFGDFPPVRLEAREILSTEAPSDMMNPLTVFGVEEQRLAGVTQWSARVEGEDLRLAIRLRRPLAREVGCSVYLFGYRDDTPFGEMPKLHVAVGELRHRVRDGRRSLARREVRVRRSGRDLDLRVPLAMLGEPHRILTTALMYAGPLPLEGTSWRILELGDPSARGR